MRKRPQLINHRGHVAPGQVQYHLKQLTGQDAVVADQYYGRTHYYTPEYDAWERGAIAVCRRETARDILFVVLESGPATPAAVADSLDIARSTLEWHLDHLDEQGLVDKRRDTQNHVTLVVSNPAAVVGLIEEITPSLSDRMVDRFTRLVDSLLEG
ncbi:MAG: winged helix-turn-helix transcriptional regulator [Haloarculaceae archaeon]